MAKKTRNKKNFALIDLAGPKKCFVFKKQSTSFKTLNLVASLELLSGLRLFKNNDFQYGIPDQSLISKLLKKKWQSEALLQKQILKTKKLQQNDAAATMVELIARSAAQTMQKQKVDVLYLLSATNSYLVGRFQYHFPEAHVIVLRQV